MKNESQLKSSKRGVLLRLAIFMALMISAFIIPSSALADFGYTEDSTNYTIDTGANLVFKVKRSNGDISSLIYNGTDYNGYTNKNSHVETGLGYYILGCLSAGYASAWWTSLVYAILYALLILFFTYFYSSIQFNPIELANNMKKSGGYIPGIRPGKPTSDYIGKISSRLNLVGAFFLAIIAILPVIVGAIFNVTALQIGGTSLLIMEGVALETVRQIESQMTMRHYKGFLE